MSKQDAPRRFPIADALSGTRHVFVRELELMATVGVHEHEKRAPQRIVVSLDLTVRDGGALPSDRLDDVVCYERVVSRIKEICAAGHVNLIETLAERMAEAALEDPRVLGTRVRIEKPDAFADCRSVGIEIERLQPRV